MQQTEIIVENVLLLAFYMRTNVLQSVTKEEQK